VLRVSGKWSFSLGIRGGNRYNGIKRPLDVKPALRWLGKPLTISTDPFLLKIGVENKIKKFLSLPVWGLRRAGRNLLAGRPTRFDYFPVLASYPF
jgi:hypothetical protein